MLECRDAGGHAAWRAGPRLCVECALTSLAEDPRAALPLLAEELALVKLQVASAARFIVAIVNLGRSSSFPADLLDIAVQVVGAVVRNLRPEERDDAASALLDTCLILSGGTSESRGGVLATALVPLCLQPRSQRLLVAKSGELQELLLSPGLSGEVRGCVLAALRETSSPNDLMVAVATRLTSSTATAPHQLVALLDAMIRVICTLPRTLTRAGSEKLLAVSGELVGVVKRALMSRDPALQECGAQCLLTLLLREETPLAAAALAADLGEFLAEALNSTQPSLLQVVFRCVWLLCTTAAPVLYARGLALRLVHGLVRALHLVLVQPAAQDVARAGMGLLAILLLNSQRVDAGPEIAQAGLQVLALVRQALQGEEVAPDVRTAATRVLADLFLVTPRGAAAEWPDVAETVRTAAELPAPPAATCPCFVLRLARGAVTATSGEGKESRAVQQWAEEAILKHSKDCVLLGPVSAVACGRLLAALEQLFAEPSWDGALRLAKELGALGFLALANRLLTEAELVKRGPGVLARVLAILARPMLGLVLTWEYLREGLRDLSDPWLHPDTPPQSQESRDAVLTLSYCHVITSESPVACCRPLLPGLLALLRSPLAAAERLPVHGARSALFLLAVASHCETPTWPVPPEAQPLLLRWAPAAHLVYTHHPAVLRWALAQNPGVAPPELQAALVAEWLARDEPPLRVSVWLREHPSGLTCLLVSALGFQQWSVDHAGKGPTNSKLAEETWFLHHIDRL